MASVLRIEAIAPAAACATSGGWSTRPVPSANASWSPRIRDDGDGLEFSNVGGIGFVKQDGGASLDQAAAGALLVSFASAPSKIKRALSSWL